MSEDVVEVEEVKPTIFIRGEGGVVWEMDLPLSESHQDRLIRGHLKQVWPNGEGGYTDLPPVESDPEDPENGTNEGTSQDPAKPVEPDLKASKKHWVGFAVANGLSPDDADLMTKQDLIDRFSSASRQD